jgi:hypothetical protein
VYWKILTFVAIIVLSTTAVISTSFASPQDPSIGVYVPQNIDAESDTFTATINISSATPFVGYQFYLYWNRTYINATSLIDTPPAAWSPYPHVMGSVEWNFNETHGRIVRAGLDTHIPLVATTGKFTIATIAFKVLADSSIQSDVSLDLDYGDTFLSSPAGQMVKPYYVYDADVHLKIDKTTTSDEIANNPSTNASDGLPLGSAQETYIGIWPSPNISVRPSDTFMVKINVSSPVPFVGYQLYLYWNRAYINATDLTNTPPAVWGTYAFMVYDMKWNFNATHGRVIMAAIDSHIPLVAVTGIYSVATFTFKVLETWLPQADILDLAPGDTFLCDAHGNMIKPYYVYDGDTHLISERVMNNNLKLIDEKSKASAPTSSAKNTPSNKVTILPDFIPVWLPIGAIILVVIVATFNIPLPSDYFARKQDKNRRQNSSGQLEDKKKV